MPGKPPYFPFYVNDFAADDVVELMTTEQVGAFTLLLCKAWTQEPAGTVPNDNSVLARWARLSLDRWLEVKDGVLAAFRIGGDGRYHQKRMKHEFARLMDTITKKSRGGKRGAKARWQSYGTPNDTPNDNPMPRAFGSGSGSESGFQTGGGSGGRVGDLPLGFAAFWSAYPRKVKRSDAAAAWLKINPDHDLQSRILAAVESQKRSPDWTRDDGKYIPHPTTWLNQKRWEDEPPAVAAADRDPDDEIPAGPMDERRAREIFNIPEPPEGGEP